MSRMFRSTLALLLLMGLPLAAGAQEVGKDVKPDHWAYEAVQDLARKGLIKGYPPDGNFLGQRTVHFNAGSGGDPILARPIFDVLAGRESAELVAFPGLLAGGVSGATGRCCCPCVPMQPQQAHAIPSATSERRQSIVHLVSESVVSCHLSVVKLGKTAAPSSASRSGNNGRLTTDN